MRLLNKGRIRRINYVNKMEKGVLLISEERKSKIRKKYVLYTTTTDTSIIECACYSCTIEKLEEEFNEYEIYYLKEHTKLIRRFRFNLKTDKEEYSFDKELFMKTFEELKLNQLLDE